MKRINFRKHLTPTVLIAATLMTASALADTQERGPGMMGGYDGGWMGGGYGGIWVLVLLVAVVAGLVGWIVAKQGK